MLKRPSAGKNRDAETAFERYVALTGDATASPQDPLVRRFCDAYDAGLDRAVADESAAKARRLVRLLREQPSAADR
jgi:hypothetical protein